MRKNPSQHSRIATFIRQRILALAPRKSQQDIAYQAGFRNANVLSMIKSGKTKVPLERVPALAKALEVDPADLFRLALMLSEDEGAAAAVAAIFGTVVSANERIWLEALRAASPGPVGCR